MEADKFVAWARPGQDAPLSDCVARPPGPPRQRLIPKVTPPDNHGCVIDQLWDCKKQAALRLPLALEVYHRIHEDQAKPEESHLFLRGNFFGENIPTSSTSKLEKVMLMHPLPHPFNNAFLASLTTSKACHLRAQKYVATGSIFLFLLHAKK